MVVRRPVGDVFAFLTNPLNDRKWQAGIVESRVLTSGDMGMGSRASEVRTFMGRRFESTYEVIAYEPDQRFSIRGASELMPIEASYLLAALGEDSTRLTSVMEWRAGGLLGRLAANVFLRMAKKQSDTDFQKLKAVLEADRS